jgi:predicted nucleic acid-binding Zn ribbon protein
MTDTTHDPIDAVAAVLANPAPLKNCPGCGTAFPAGGRGLGKVFCSTPCRTGFQNRMKSEGAPLAPLVKAWTKTRHAKPGTREAAICTFARGQITAIASVLNDADEDRGSSAVDYVGALMDSGTMWCDRTRK